MRTLAVRNWLIASVLLLTSISISAAEECRLPSIGLVLGSGGAGGLAHIAMLEVFEELEIQPNQIAGTSIGAIIGAMAAAGLDSGKIQEIFRQFGGSAMDPFAGLMNDNDGPGWIDLLNIDLESGSLIDADGFLDFIAGKFDAREFVDLDIPLKIIATNYWDAEQHIFDTGNLLVAIKASMAVPGLFSPVTLDDKLLIDGGTANPLPGDVLDGHDIVIAIDVTGMRDPQSDDSPDLLDLLFKTFEIMQQSIIRGKLEQYPPDIYIKPALSDVRLLHFDRVDEVIEQASGAAAELREQIQSKIECLD